MVLSSLLLTLLQGAPEAAGSAEETSSSPFGGLLIPMLLIFGIFYIVLIRPEGKKKKQRDAMLAALKKGDRVVTTSGIYANVAQIQEDQVTLQVADGVRMRFLRAAIQTVLEDDASADERSKAKS